MANFKLSRTAIFVFSILTSILTCAQVFGNLNCDVGSLIAKIDTGGFGQNAVRDGIQIIDVDPYAFQAVQKITQAAATSPARNLAIALETFAGMDTQQFSALMHSYASLSTAYDDFPRFVARLSDTAKIQRRLGSLYISSKAFWEKPLLHTPSESAMKTFRVIIEKVGKEMSASNDTRLATLQEMGMSTEYIRNALTLLFMTHDFNWQKNLVKEIAAGSDFSFDLKFDVENSFFVNASDVVREAIKVKDLSSRKAMFEIIKREFLNLDIRLNEIWPK